MTEVLFIVQRETHILDGKTCRWLYVQSCPHGDDIGAIEATEGPSFNYLSPLVPDGMGGGSHRVRAVWEWHDLGNGRCRIAPSLLVPGLHGGTDCHFGPGEFAFVWLEPAQLRDPTTGLPMAEPSP